MRLLLAAVIAAAAITSAQAADTPQQASMKSCAATWKTMSAADKGKTKYTDYMGTCMKAGATPKTAGAAPAPAASMAMTAKPKATAANSMKMAAPTGGGSAKCKDGTTVTYKNRQGTCSGHGGVATWL
jgi:opacity protein-like surface antigen